MEWLKRTALLLLTGVGGLAILAIIWLVIFGITNGAAPVPTAPGEPPTPALIMLETAVVAVVVGFVLAVIYRIAVPRGRG